MKQTSCPELIKTVVVLLITVVVCGFLCVITVPILTTLTTLDTLVDSKEHNKRTVEQLLKFVQENPTGPFPQKDVDWVVRNTDWGRLVGDSRCWTFLQDAVAQNSNQYSLIAYDNGIGRFRDVDDSIVQVDFADGRRVKMVFYQERLVACSRN